MVMENSIFVLKQQDYCSVGYAIRQQKISGSLIRDSYLFNQKIGSKRIKKILIFSSGRLQISRHNSLVGICPASLENLLN